MLTTEQHILAELTRLGLPFEVRKNDISIPCPFHKSFGFKLWIHKSGSMARCWVPHCGWKGNWNTLAAEIGGKALNDQDIDEFSLLRNKLSMHEEKGLREPELPLGLVRWKHGAWRSISEEWLRELPAYRWYDDSSHGYRILFPIHIWDDLLGWVAAKIDSTDKVFPKYRNSMGLDAHRVLFPFNKITNNVAVIVEGPYDALRLQFYKIPAVALLGAGQWSSISQSDLTTLGVDTLIILPDGDESGRAMQHQIENDARDTFKLFSVTLPEGEDPGSIGEDYLLWLKDRVTALTDSPKFSVDLNKALT